MSRSGLSPGRLEAFSDGVIAVIITIMVLELKVPGADGVAGLLVVFPTVFLYLLTFVQIGIYWVNHHYLVDEVETVSHGILWANLVFLFCLSLFPFATDWIGVKGLSSFTTALYAAVSILPGLGYMALWTQIRSQSAAAAHASWGKQIASVSLYLTAIPVAYYRPAASLALIGTVAVLWLLPPKARVHPEGGHCKSPRWTGAEPKESTPPRADKK
ncbi:MAG: TMEM175 family protein [Terracidiphilus sp.]